jgi:hypothetical protein
VNSALLRQPQIGQLVADLVEDVLQVVIRGGIEVVRRAMPRTFREASMLMKARDW